MRLTDKQRRGYAERLAKCLSYPTTKECPPGTPETVDEARSALDRGGWTANETAFVTNGNTDWLVACQRGGDWMFSHGQTRLAAWRRAVARARQRNPDQFEFRDLSDYAH